MRTRAFHIQTPSVFGQKIVEGVAEKRDVARAVANHLMEREICDLFINDGTSTSYVWCYFLQRWMAAHGQGAKLRVSTNNCDVAMQALFEHSIGDSVSIELAPGGFDAMFCAALGSEANRWVAEKCIDNTCLIAVSSLDAKYGPAGNSNVTRDIKKAVMGSAGRLIIVTDSRKLQRPVNVDKVASDEKWTEWIEKRRDKLWVFTDTQFDRGSLTPPVEKLTAESPAASWERQNAAHLLQKLGDHFVTVPTPVAMEPCHNCLGAGVREVECQNCDGAGFVPPEH